jgi:hypothetical protein
MPFPGGRDMAVRVLYVGGLPRSGSTLTDLMLDRLPGHRGVGELFYLFRNGARHDTACSCGAAFSRCEFWTDVGKAAFGGWDEPTITEALRLQGRVDRTATIPAILAGGGTSSFRQDVASYVGMLERLYLAIGEVAPADVIVDSSKRPSLAYVLRRSAKIELSCVHVLRDPRGVAYSFGKHVELAPGTDVGAEMPRSTPRKVARRWVTVNASIAALARLGVRYLRVRYEDLSADPRGQFIRVAEFQGLRPDQVDSSFLTEGGMRVQPTHLAVGGRIRHTDGVLPIRLDEAWRDDLRARDRRLVDAVTAVSRHRYGYP